MALLASVVLRTVGKRALRPLLRTLPKSAGENYSIIRAGVKRGLSIRGISRAIREAGGRISERSISTLYPAISTAYRYGTQMRLTALDQAFDFKRFPFALTKIGSRYQIVLEGDESIMGGAPIKRYMTINTNKSSLTPRQIYEEAEEVMRRRGSGVRWTDLTIIEGRQRA